MANDKTQPRAALITGAGRRIGSTIARALAQAGYSVVLHTNHSRAEAEKLASEIVSAGGRASVVLADLADAAAVRGLVPAAAAFGPGATALTRSFGASACSSVTVALASA